MKDTDADSHRRRESRRSEDERKETEKDHDKRKHEGGHHHAPGHHVSGAGAGKDDDPGRIVIDRDHDRVVITVEVGEGCEDGPGTDGGGTGGPTGPIGTPFLVIPTWPGDGGGRPIPVGQAINNKSVQAVIANPIVAKGWPDFEVQLSCVVADLGVVGCGAGLAEFYIGDTFSVANPGHAGLTPAQVKASAQLVGYATFQVPPGGEAMVKCANLWKPGSSAAAKKGVLVQVRDLFADQITAPFDALDDRHVGRKDDAEVMVSQGTALLKGTYSFDLDTGVQALTGTNPPSMDIWWEQKNTLRRQMVPQHGALIVNLGGVNFDSLTPANLRALAYVNTPVIGNNDATNQLVAGDVFAVKTDLGNYAKVLVAVYGYNIKIQWVTYPP